jgi:hypothetical protein
MHTLTPSVAFELDKLPSRTALLAMLITLEEQVLHLQWQLSHGELPSVADKRAIAEVVVKIMSAAFPGVRFYVKTFSGDYSPDV